MFPERKETFPECLRNQNLFRRPFVSGTDGVNCPVTNSPAIFKHLVRRGLLCWDFIANTGNLHHKTVWCNKIDSGINYRVLLRLCCKYLMFLWDHSLQFYFFIMCQTCWFCTFVDTLPKPETGHFFRLGRNMASKA